MSLKENSFINPKSIFPIYEASSKFFVPEIWTYRKSVTDRLAYNRISKNLERLIDEYEH